VVNLADPLSGATLLRGLSLLSAVIGISLGRLLPIVMVKRGFMLLLHYKNLLFLVSCLSLPLYWGKIFVFGPSSVPVSLNTTIWLTLSIQMSSPVDIRKYLRLAFLSIAVELASLKRTGLILCIAILYSASSNIKKISLRHGSAGRILLSSRAIKILAIFVAILLIFVFIQFGIGSRLTVFFDYASFSDLAGYLARVTSGRFTEGENYVTFLRQHPFAALIGSPTNSLIESCDLSGNECESRYYLHNSYLSLAFQMGFPLATLIYIEFLSILKRLWKLGAGRQESGELFFFVGMICLVTLINSLASSVFTLYSIAFFWFAFAERICSNPIPGHYCEA
jgi:hypothetical protein